MPAPDDKADQGDQKASAPQRLQSLSARGGRGGIRGGRFMPNAVGRRSKEERESTAPAVKPQPPSPQADGEKGKPANRNKFDRRKQRQLGTRAEAAGPLAAPTIASNASAARSARPTGTSTTAGSSSGRGAGGLRVKAEPESSLSASLAADVRIDMSSVSDKESFIPLRMPTESITPETVASDSSAESAAPATKSEDSLAVAEAPGEAEAKLENDRLSHDHLQIDEGSLYLIQLPDLSLAAGKAPSDSPLYGTNKQNPEQVKSEEIKIKDENVETGQAPPAEATKPAEDNTDGQAQSLEGSTAENPEGTAQDVTMEDNANEPVIGASGRLGTLRKHASGKLTMVMGDTVYEVIQGTHEASQEELVLINENTHRSHDLGGVKSRILVIPDLDSLHI